MKVPVVESASFGPFPVYIDRLKDKSRSGISMPCFVLSRAKNPVYILMLLPPTDMSIRLTTLNDQSKTMGLRIHPLPCAD